MDKKAAPSTLASPRRRQLITAGPAAAMLAAVPGLALSRSGTVKIGSVLSVTGPAAFLGEDMKAGMELAIEQINAKGGIGGRKIEWFFYDAESQTAKGLAVTRRLMTQDRVDMIVGGGNMSGMALAMLQETEREKMPFISTEGSMQIVNPIEDRQYTFKSTVDDDQVMERLCDYFAKKGWKKIALLADSSGFGQSAAEQLRRVAPGRGIEALYESFNPADTDLTPQLTKLRAAGPQAIICWTVTPTGVVFMRQGKSLGIDAQLIHSYGFVDQRYMKLAGDASKDVLLVSVKFPVGDQLPDSDGAKVPIAELTSAFEARFKRRPNQFAAQSYDAIQLARLAVEKGGTDKTKIRDALRGIRGYQGVGGVFNFSEKRHSGLSKDDLVLLRWEKDRFILADYK
jgi:branched-chain amino acid transport system substrate-binding protein